MSEIYTVIVGILGILAVSGLFVGVTNDAVNFLNSAIGSKAASMKIILTVASVGIIIGVVTSSGMMEVARSGMFNPGLFTFHEVMMLYLGVMFANVILLDLYNSWGLPTSTTVSLIFCLLGAAIAVSIYKISNDPEQSVSSLGHYINTLPAKARASAKVPERIVMRRMLTLKRWMKNSSSEQTTQQMAMAEGRWLSISWMKAWSASMDLRPLKTAK